jgi:hypothetical protein
MKPGPSCTRVTLVLVLGLTAAPVCAEPHHLAQAEIRIPSDAQLERMEQQGIVTPPLYDGGLGRDPGIAGADRQMEEQAHRIDEKLLRGGICRDC